MLSKEDQLDMLASNRRHTIGFHLIGMTSLEQELDEILYPMLREIEYGVSHDLDAGEDTSDAE